MATSSEQSTELAEAVEQRRRELGLTIGDFAAAAGLTRQGLDPIRRGVVKQYEDRTLFGVARALRWAGDWYDRILAGDDPAELATPNGHDVDEVVDLTGLTEDDKAQIRAIVERFKRR